jgi:hypothetical protein
LNFLWEKSKENYLVIGKKEIYLLFIYYYYLGEMRRKKKRKKGEEYVAKHTQFPGPRDKVHLEGKWMLRMR